MIKHPLTTNILYSPPPFAVAGGSLSPHRSSGLAATAASTSSKLIPGNLARSQSGNAPSLLAQYDTPFTLACTLLSDTGTSRPAHPRLHTLPTGAPTPSTVTLTRSL